MAKPGRQVAPKAFGIRWRPGRPGDQEITIAPFGSASPSFDGFALSSVNLHRRPRCGSGTACCQVRANVRVEISNDRYEPHLRERS